MDVFDLVAKLTLDTKDYEDKTKETASGAKTLGAKIAAGLGNVGKVAAKVGIAAVTAASGAIVAVGKQAVSEFANYEQLVGGVETLFGAGGKTFEEYFASSGKSIKEATEEYSHLQRAQQDVLNNASQAYKTSGLSANEYMETVTSFSASLLQSLEGDTVKAAAYADKAVIDMSDNANKMGTDMSSIQAAYQGFAKQNYTMLDNLKLGYGGTKTEMERLITDAENLDSTFKATRDENGDLTMSYADIVDAIHIVQDEMGITGTTAKEASTTIQGSISSAKAAYKNWLTGLADENADIEQLTEELFQSIETVANNLLPVVARVLESLGKTLQSKLPQLIQRGISYVMQRLPQILALGVKLVGAVISGLAQGFSVLYGMISQWVQNNLIEPIKQKVSDMIDAGQLAITNLINGIKNKFSELTSAGRTALTKLKQGFVNKFHELVTAGRNAIAKVKEGLSNAMSSIVDIGRQVVDKIKEGISSAWSGLTEWFNGIWDKLFGDRKVDVSVNTNEGGSQHAIGLDFVPYNGFPATLHRGEAVLTAREADEWRRGTSRGGESNITVNVYPQRGQSETEIASQVQRVLIRWDKQRKAAGIA